MTMTREQVKAELIKDPEYNRIANLPDNPTAIDFSVSVFMAYKMVFGEHATVDEWVKYTYTDRQKREHYQQLLELIYHTELTK